MKQGTKKQKEDNSLLLFALHVQIFLKNLKLKSLELEFEAGSWL